MRMLWKQNLLSGNRVCIVIEGDSQDALDVFQAYIASLVKDPQDLVKEIRLQKTKKAHIFVDLSNIMLGAQKNHSGFDDKVCEIFNFCAVP